MTWGLRSGDWGISAGRPMTEIFIDLYIVTILFVNSINLFFFFNSTTDFHLMRVWILEEDAGTYALFFASLPRYSRV